MFVPLTKEHDMYDINGIQLDEINTVAEYVFHTVFDIIPLTPLDEDGDEQKFLNSINPSSYTIVNFFDFQMLPIAENESDKMDLYNDLLSLIVEELFSPPPEIG